MFTQPPTRQGERGVVLLLALIALLLISAVGAAILFMTASESTLVGYQRSTTRAYNAAVWSFPEMLVAAAFWFREEPPGP